MSALTVRAVGLTGCVFAHGLHQRSFFSSGSPKCGRLRLQSSHCRCPMSTAPGFCLAHSPHHRRIFPPAAPKFGAFSPQLCTGPDGSETGQTGGEDRRRRPD